MVFTQKHYILCSYITLNMQRIPKNSCLFLGENPKNSLSHGFRSPGNCTCSVITVQFKNIRGISGTHAYETHFLLTRQLPVLYTFLFSNHCCLHSRKSYLHYTGFSKSKFTKLLCMFPLWLPKLWCKMLSIISGLSTQEFLP